MEELEFFWNGSYVDVSSYYTGNRREPWSGEAVSTEYPDLSRGDMWQIASLGAIDAGIDFANDLASRGVPELSITSANFRIGRQDCDTSPYTDDEHHFPNPLLSYDELMDYYDTYFGLEPNEVN